METTSKIACNILVDVLAAQGIRKFVVSPGSRNAPIIVALSRRDDVVKHVVVDERSAAFVALGIAQQSGEAVGIVCTSGTALLNYAPAVAEAYYQKLPLIVISADRPREWIDQDDSQTIRQYEALSQFVKKSYDLPARCDDATAQWYVNRMVNDAVIEATGGQPAPVHINLQLDEPLGCFADYKEGGERVIESVQPPASLSTATIALLEKIASGKKVLVIAGFGKENPALSEAVEAFRETTGAVVLTETIANIRSDNAVRAIDRTLLAMDKEDEYVPDVLITLGGALVSRMIKVLMRRHRPAEHWHVGVTSTTVDCMQSLTKRIQVDPVAFFSAFRPIANRNYAMLWKQPGASRKGAPKRLSSDCPMERHESIFHPAACPPCRLVPATVERHNHPLRPTLWRRNRLPKLLQQGSVGHRRIDIDGRWSITCLQGCDVARHR